MLAAVPEDGSTIGNQALQDALKGQFGELTDEQFTAARDALIESGKVWEATAERQKAKKAAASLDRKQEKSLDRNGIESSDRSNENRSNENRSNAASPVTARAAERVADTRDPASAEKIKIQELALARPISAYSLDFGGYATRLFPALAGMNRHSGGL